MNHRFDIFKFLTGDELRVLREPSSWRWVSSIREPEIRPIRLPAHLEWAKSHAHSPPQRELFICLSGSSPMVFRDKVYRVVPGTVMLFDRRERHDRDSCDRHKSMRHLWLHMSNRHVVTANINTIDKQGHQVDRFLKLITGGNASLVSDIWERSRDEPSQEMYWSFLKSLITALFVEAVSDWCEERSVNPQHLVVNSICDYIRQHMADDLSLERLAQLAGYSPYFFHRLFIRYAGKPLHQYVIDARLERSKELLGTGHAINAVSDEVGMVSPSYFSRFFKRHTGLTPTFWRDRHHVQRRS